ncbi:hypothetical protein [Asticcacaulis sp. W401b]|uniref:hypothetical protein n=1 Tax=Asticcacaulis sp. W401b TaxID=3388666 RepID=UPI003970E66A
MSRVWLFSTLLLACSGAASAADTTLFDGTQPLSIVHDKNETVSLAAQMLSDDLKALTGQTAKVSKRLSDCAPQRAVFPIDLCPLVNHARSISTGRNDVAAL